MGLALPRRRVPRRHHHRPWYKRITRGQVTAVVGGVLGILIVVFAVQAVQAASSLRLAANQAGVLQSQIIAGDDVGAKSTLGGLQESARTARSKTDGPLWSLASRTPFFGKNVSAVSTVAKVVDQIATQALPPLVALSKKVNLNTFSPHDGRVNLAELMSIRPSVAAADRALRAANRELRGINSNSLLVPIRGPVSTMQLKVATASSAASSSNTAALLLPSMLGANETRRYLLLIQNNAETRSTGGIAGSFAILKADKGKLSMGQQGSIQDILPFPEPVVPMEADEATVFAPTMVTDLRDINFTPNFPRSAEIGRALIDKKFGVNVDGVISVDPIAMSYMLAGTGPVTLSDGTVLDQNNAVDVLLNNIYRAYSDNSMQDDLFKSAARKIFDVVKSGQGQSRVVIEALVTAANENRLTVWSSHEQEKQAIQGTGLSGAVGGDDGATPHIGVYLSDAASTKMEYYLDFGSFASSVRCLAGGIQELRTTTDLTSDAPLNAKNLPVAVTGDGKYTPRGTMNIIVRIYSPFGGGFTSVRVNGKEQTVYADRYLGRNVTRVQLQIKPGQSYTITTSMISGKGQTKDAVLSTTPGVQPTRNDVVIPSACH